MTALASPSPVTFPTPCGFRKIGPGQYAVWRKIEIAGAFHAAHVVCANPAYAIKVLKAWEAQVRAEAKARMEQAA